MREGWVAYPNSINEARRFIFENGYGASVVRGAMTYGGPTLWELAVLHGGHITYDTPITNDVIGWLTESAVDELLEQIEALPPLASKVER